jgi:hypothetical protein
MDSSPVNHGNTASLWVVGCAPNLLLMTWIVCCSQGSEIRASTMWVQQKMQMNIIDNSLFYITSHHSANYVNFLKSFAFSRVTITVWLTSKILPKRWPHIFHGTAEQAKCSFHGHYLFGVCVICPVWLFFLRKNHKSARKRMMHLWRV